MMFRILVGLILLLGINCIADDEPIATDIPHVDKAYGILADVVIDSLTYLHINIEIGLSDSTMNKWMRNRANHKEEIVIIYNGITRKFTLEEFTKLLGFRDPKFF